MPLEIFLLPPTQPSTETILALTLTDNGNDDGRENRVEFRSATKDLAAFLDEAGVNRNDLRYCIVRIRNNYTAFFAENPSELEALLNDLPGHLPKAKHLAIHLSSEFASNTRFLSLLRTTGTIVFPALEQNSSKGTIQLMEVHLDGNSVTMSNILHESGESRTDKTLTLFSSQPGPLVQNVVQYCKDITIAHIESSATMNTFQKLFSLSTLKSIKLSGIKLTAPEIATIGGALASPSDSGKKRKRIQNGMRSLFDLRFDDVEIEKYADFLSLCRSLETNQSIVYFRIRQLTLLDSNDSTVGPLIQLLKHNTNIGVLQSSGNARFVHRGQRFESEEAKQQDQMLTILKTSQFSLVSLSFGEWKNPLPGKVKDCLGINYYGLMYQMLTFVPCTRYHLGRRLARAKDTVHSPLHPDFVTKPCLLSAIFVLFQAHPTLIKLIPEGSLAGSKMAGT